MMRASTSKENEETFQWHEIFYFLIVVMAIWWYIFVKTNLTIQLKKKKDYLAKTAFTVESNNKFSFWLRKRTYYSTFCIYFLKEQVCWNGDSNTLRVKIGNWKKYIEKWLNHRCFYWWLFLWRNCLEVKTILVGIKFSLSRLLPNQFK